MYIEVYGSLDYTAYFFFFFYLGAIRERQREPLSPEDRSKDLKSTGESECGMQYNKISDSIFFFFLHRAKCMYTVIANNLTAEWLAVGPEMYCSCDFRTPTQSVFCRCTTNSYHLKKVRLQKKSLCSSDASDGLKMCLWGSSLRRLTEITF